MQAVDVVQAVLVVTTAATVTFFVAVYATRPWYRSSVGRSVMTWSFALMLFTWVGFLVSFLDFAGSKWVLLITYGIIGAGALYQDVVLVRTIRRHERNNSKHVSEM